MERKTRSSAELAMMFRNVQTPKRSNEKPNKAFDRIAGAVNGGHKAGKRKRGASLLKQQPATNTRTELMEIRDIDGHSLATYRTRIYKDYSRHTS